MKARTLLLSACLLAGTLLVPAFVFAQPLSANAQEEQAVQEFLDVFTEQLTYRKQVEENSFQTTQRLCEVFKIRQKYQMGLRPDPVTEAWVKTAHFDAKTRKDYNKSLDEWYGIGNEGVLTNWGVKETPGQEESDWVLKQSRFTRVLVSTDGFARAAADCGELNYSLLRQFLFEQERAQTVVTYVAAFGVAARVMMAGVRIAGPTLRASFLGHAMARISWKGIKKSAAVALVAYVLYSATMEFWPGPNTQKSKPLTLEDEMILARDRNIQDALKRWVTYLERPNELYFRSEEYLKQNRVYVQEMQKLNESKLIKAGNAKIEAVTAKFSAADDLTPEEAEIFMSSVYYSASKLFLSRNP